ncbi:hypothetical protein DPMN_111821 [Dreissena polymorpha]|uniref:P2X purinoreceptor 7 intracellular domain-containing protein n=1 Tax=Dreissena polymorpha TaxID=45954 RepID=A0A9D4QQ45_DREPO|nr:hypothetical protein DPMN_111821 [Dreissena polymorpha]
MYVAQEMQLMVTDTMALHIQQTFFALQAESVEDSNRAFRHAAYRQYVLWMYGQLERSDRRTVPACCVKIIREKFPSDIGQYTGFIPARHGVGW